MRILPNLSVLKDSVLSTNFLPCLTYFYLSRLYATLGFTVTVGDLSSASRRPWGILLPLHSYVKHVTSSGVHSNYGVVDYWTSDMDSCDVVMLRENPDKILK